MAGESVPNSGQIWNDGTLPWQWQTSVLRPTYKDPSITWNDNTLPWKAGSPGPFVPGGTTPTFYIYGF